MRQFIYPALFVFLAVAASCVRKKAAASSVIAVEAKAKAKEEAEGACSTASGDDVHIKAMLGMLSESTIEGPHQPANFIRSYVGLDRTYIYDASLAVIALSHAGERIAAQKILNALWNLQNGPIPALSSWTDTTGSWYFSYYSNGKTDYPGENGAFPLIAGSDAWVVMAINAYHQAFHDSAFDPMARANLDYLMRTMDRTRVNGKMGLPFSPQQPATGWNEESTFSFEHMIDMYSALNYFAKNTESSDAAYAGKLRARATELRSFLETHWNGKHFYAGTVSLDGDFNKSEYYLDTQAWGVLALGTKSADGQTDYVKGLDFDCDSFYHEGASINGTSNIFGFFDSLPFAGPPASKKFVWSEGTLGYVSAMKLVSAERGVTYTCRGKDADEFLGSILSMADDNNRIAYATPNDNPDFPSSGSIAGTAWTYFVKYGLNPFQPDQKTECGSEEQPTSGSN